MSDFRRPVLVLVAALAVSAPLGAQESPAGCYDLTILRRAWAATAASPSAPSRAQDNDPLRIVPERFSLTDRPVEEEISGAPPLRWIEPLDSLGLDWPYAHWSLKGSVLTLGWSNGFGGYSSQLEPDSTMPGVWRGAMDSFSDEVYRRGEGPGRWIYEVVMVPLSCGGAL